MHATCAQDGTYHTFRLHYITCEKNINARDTQGLVAGSPPHGPTVRVPGGPPPAPTPTVPRVPPTVGLLRRLAGLVPRSPIVRSAAAIVGLSAARRSISPAEMDGDGGDGGGEVS